MDGQSNSSVEKTDGAVNIKKSVSEDGSELTLEAWVTDEKSTMQTYVPMDIVLVLDVSGSMDEKTESYAYQKTEKTKWTPSDIRWAISILVLTDTGIITSGFPAMISIG